MLPLCKILLKAQSLASTVDRLILKVFRSFADRRPFFIQNCCDLGAFGTVSVVFNITSVSAVIFVIDSTQRFFTTKTTSQDNDSISPHNQTLTKEMKQLQLQ